MDTGKECLFSFHLCRDCQSPDLSVYVLCVARRHFNEFVVVGSVWKKCGMENREKGIAVTAPASGKGKT